jgi:hypothetical protein
MNNTSATYSRKVSKSNTLSSPINSELNNNNIDIILKTLETAKDFARLQAIKKRKSVKKTLRAIGTPLTLESRIKRGLRYLEAKIQRLEKTMIGKSGQELSDILIQRAELQKYLNLLAEKLKLL